MPISFFLMIAAALIFRLPAWEAERRQRLPKTGARRWRQRAFAFNLAACGILLLALWRLPAWSLSEHDLALLRYGGAFAVGVALLADGWKALISRD